MQRRKQLDPNQSDLFHTAFDPEDFQADEREIPRRQDAPPAAQPWNPDTWRVVTHPRSDARNRSFTADKRAEDEARSYVQWLQRHVGSRDVTIVLSRSWRRGWGPDLVWCLWYKEGGVWIADEQH